MEIISTQYLKYVSTHPFPIHSFHNLVLAIHFRQPWGFAFMAKNSWLGSGGGGGMVGGCSSKENERPQALNLPKRLCSRA